MRVLIVEDEEVMADALQEGLGYQGIAADTAYDGDQALRQVEVNDYDVVVLDRDLPGTHGDDVCRAIVRGHPGVRVIMVTAATRLADKVGGFGLGADDYLTKPFALQELVARLRALGRRPETQTPPVLRFGELSLDVFRREVHRRDTFIKLNRKQFGVLELLMRADGGVVSAETMLEKVWDENIDPFTTAPRVTVSTLRKALGSPDLIGTIAGIGYHLIRVGDPRG